MRIKPLMITASLALFFLAVPQAAHAQKDGEAQAVIFDANDHPTLKFTNKSAKRQGCGAFVSYTLTGNQEETIALRVSHMHAGSLGWKTTLPETGWLYITPSRIIFKVEAGDPSHAIDIARTDLMDKPIKRLGGKIFISAYVGVKINLKEKLAASNSSEQKFVFSIVGDKRCYVENPDPYSKFIERAGSDFNGTLAEFKQVADALKQSGRSQQISEYMVPPLKAGEINAVPSTDIPLPIFPTVSTDPGQESPDNTGVDITSEPAGAEIYVDGKSNGRTPAKIMLSAGEHTVKVTRPGYKDWERKIMVEQGSVKTFNAILEKQ
jgi:hypothetical protein